jgi:hypothetical protein
MGAGFVAHIESPTTVKRFDIQAYAPNRDNYGFAVAYLHPATGTDFWYGTASLDNDSTKGWHRRRAVARTFTWSHYAAPTSVPDQTGFSGTIRDFATTTFGGDGAGAELGFLFGCNPTTVFVDALAVGDGRATKVFDFGGIRTLTRQTIGGSAKARKTVTYGKRLKISGYSRLLARDRVFPTAMTFQRRPAAGGHFKKFSKAITGADGRASAASTPSTSSRFRIRSAGDQTHEPSTSRVIKVVVRMKVRASLADSTVVKGHRWHVRGHVGPNKRTTVLLQRIVNGKWATFKRGHSARNGDYAFTGTATSTGQRYFRVLARGGRGNADGLSNHVLLKVVKPSGGGGGTTPPDPPDDPTPPPPPPPEGFLP